jgi:hypothetical protein
MGGAGSIGATLLYVVVIIGSHAAPAVGTIPVVCGIAPPALASASDVLLADPVNNAVAGAVGPKPGLVCLRGSEPIGAEALNAAANGFSGSAVAGISPLKFSGCHVAACDSASENGFPLTFFCCCVALF